MITRSFANTVTLNDAISPTKPIISPNRRRNATRITKKSASSSSRTWPARKRCNFVILLWFGTATSQVRKNVAQSIDLSAKLGLNLNFTSLSAVASARALMFTLSAAVARALCIVK